jgi:PadR family transcriptional regulator PadR
MDISATDQNSRRTHPKKSPFLPIPRIAFLERIRPFYQNYGIPIASLWQGIMQYKVAWKTLVLFFFYGGQVKRISCSARALNHHTMNVANTQIQMRKGLLEFCVLHIISRGEVYTSDLIEELTQAQMIVVEGTLYPLLNRLKSAELVTYRWVESEAGPPRKYYSITEEGKSFLLTLSDTWASLVNSTNEITSKN